MSLKQIGQFELKGTKLLVSDPCYEKGTWCTGILEALPGKWNVFVKSKEEEINYKKENWSSYHDAFMKWKKESEQNPDLPIPNLDDHLLDVVYKKQSILELWVQHESVNELPENITLSQSDIHAGVDSGQCGFYDYDLYPQTPDDRCFEPGKEKEWEETWYGQVCDKNQESGTGYVFDFGVVTNTTYGDGSYSVYFNKNSDGLVTTAKIVYDWEEE